MGCIEASAYTTGTILGTHQSLDECTEQCGVCCVPTCPSNLNSFKITQPDGCVVQNLIPFENSTSISLNEYNFCSAGGYGDWWYVGPDGNNNVMGFSEFRGPPSATVTKFPGVDHWSSLVTDGLKDYVHQEWSLNRGYSLSRSGPKPSDLVWSVGYPSGDYFIETISLGSSVVAGSMDIGAKWGVKSFGGEPEPANGEGAVYFGRTARKIKYLQCIDGILIDKTSEAFANFDADKTVSYQYENQPVVTVVVGTLAEYDYTGTTVVSPCFWGSNGADPCCEDYNDNPYANCTGTVYSMYSSNFFNESKFSEFSFIEDIPLYPSIVDAGTEGATQLVYECYDQATIPSIGQSGCLQGGVFTPSGIPAGVWHSGQNCEVFDCNA
jgi:hypothetical protein